MKTSNRTSQVILCLVATATIALIAVTITKSRSFLKKSGTGKASEFAANPQIILWAWERPTDLRFLDTKQFAVAFLGKTIQLKSDDVVVRPRLQSLQVPEGTRVIAVARIETDRDDKPSLSALQREDAGRAITAMTSLPNVSEIQIDFDAMQSQREFYRQLIFDIRRRLPSNVRLSITALASWCMYDNWLSDLPIDEAVPMLFRMSADGKQIANRLDAGDDFNAQPCRHSYGIAMDEQHPKLFPDRKVFIFNPDAWTANAVREISESSK